MNLQGKVALVTGGAVRIGRAICLALAGAGADVAVHYRKSKAEADELVGTLRAQGGRAWALDADLSKEAECRGLVDQTTRCAGKLDILVNNAAVFWKDDLRTMDAARASEQVQANFVAPMLLMQAFTACADEGRIVNLLDSRIAGSDPSCLSYVLSKKALADLTWQAAVALAPGFTVNGVAPGAVLPPPDEGPERVRELAGASPLQRTCTVEDVAGAVLFLLQSDVITGQVIFVDAGQHLVGGWGHGVVE
jgi:NAD(P)-dependent dehydrogenase (short-subunit alcohol dehydrogenase family)